MWRFLVRLFRCTLDCWLGRGTFALISFMVSRFWVIMKLQQHQKQKSFLVFRGKEADVSTRLIRGK